MDNWQDLAQRLTDLKSFELSLSFSKLVHEGNLVYAKPDEPNGFQHLRALLLAREGFAPRIHDPHITLVHPRNGVADGKLFEQIRGCFKPFVCSLPVVTFIEQNGVEPWNDHQSFQIG